MGKGGSVNPDYEYLGDYSSTPPWHSRAMSCDECRVSWTGCWDNFQCPKCGMGDLPGFGGTSMTLDEMKELHEAMLSEADEKEDGQPDYTLDDLEWAERYPHLCDVKGGDS